MLYIMRHGRTDWNARRKIQGSTDIPLNEEGRATARQAAIDCQDVHLDVCYCSPLIRARETAEIFLQGRDIPIIIDDRLTEMGFGIYEGIENSFDIPDCPVNVLFWKPEDYIVPVEGGESMEHILQRTRSFIDEVIVPELASGKDILIMGHGAMNSALTCQYKNRPVSEFWAEGIPQCKLTPLTRD